MKPSKKATRKVRALKQKDVPASRATAIKGGWVNGVLKVRHEGSKNAIGN